MTAKLSIIHKRSAGAAAHYICGSTPCCCAVNARRESAKPAQKAAYAAARKAVIQIRNWRDWQDSNSMTWFVSRLKVRQVM